MKETELIKKAIKFAKEKHNGQLDDTDKDYFKAHLEQVAKGVSVYTNDEEIIASAYLHDTIEDTETTYEELISEFGVRVADLVMEVTHEGQKDSYGYYFPRLETADGILLKICDRASNVSRMEAWSESRKAQYLKRTVFWKDGSDKPSEE